MVELPHIVSLPAYAEIRGESNTGVSETWIAELLEVRAYNNEQFVCLRWMYWPTELPASRQNLESRGEKELVWSNHFDVIHADCIKKVPVEVVYMGNEEHDLLRPPLGSIYYYRDSSFMSY